MNQLSFCIRFSAVTDHLHPFQLFSWRWLFSTSLLKVCFMLKWKVMNMKCHYETNYCLIYKYITNGEHRCTAYEGFCSKNYFSGTFLSVGSHSRGILSQLSSKLKIIIREVLFNSSLEPGVRKEMCVYSFIQCKQQMCLIYFHSDASETGLPESQPNGN